VIVVVVFLVVWGLTTHGTYAGSGDEPHYLIIAQSIAFDGDLDLANNYAQPDNLIGAGSLKPELHVREQNGMLRPVHDIGLPLLFAPYVRIVYPLAGALARALPASFLQATRLNAPLIFRHLISLAMAVLAGLLGTQLFAMFVAMGATQREGMVWALLLTLSPPLLSHAFLFFTEIPSALLVAWLVCALSAASQGRPALLVGGAIGLLLLIHVRNVALVAVFFALGARRVAPLERLARFVGAAHHWCRDSSDDSNARGSLALGHVRDDADRQARSLDVVHRRGARGWYTRHRSARQP
jgi:hypothetical protein